MSKSLLPILLIANALLSQRGFADDGGGAFAKELRPLLEEHCFKCHGEKKQKGGVELASFANEDAVLKKYKLWRGVLEQVELKDMPPDDETPLNDAERTKLLGGIRGTLALLETDHPSLRDPGPGDLRRLSRAEYNNSIRDLLGIEFDAAKEVGMPEDNTGDGYANLASALIIPPVVMEKYFDAADAILARLYSDPDTKSPNKKRDEAAFKTLFEKATTDREGARALLSRLIRVAFRRPAETAEIERALEFFDGAIARNDPFPSAIRRAIKPLLVSPNFLYRVEENRATENSRSVYRVSDVELASRLSYFLWSSAPDEGLLALAEKNELSKPENLDAQIKRMLADPKAKALTENFTTKWLQLDKLETARPSTEFFPSFNNDMKKAMRAEVVTFCEKLREEDHSILDLLNADYTYANEALAKEYGIAGVTGKELQRVALKPENHRGGILGMGGILAETSHTNRTSPTKRGKYVLEVIFGTPPAPPPANAGMFKDEKKTKEPKDFREKLAQHASDATCAGCHRKLDPLGFGLDNYDAIGAWRETSADLDTSGVLPSGVKFSGAVELKKVLWSKRDEFERNVVEQMLTYALGRQLDYYDVRSVSKIKAGLDRDGHKFSTLVRGIVNSYGFLNRRNSDSADSVAAN